MVRCEKACEKRSPTTWVGPKKFAEPVSLSSTASADLPLAGTAFGLGFDLLALRARRKHQTTERKPCVQDVEKSRGRNLREIQLSTFPQLFVQCVEEPVETHRRANARHATAVTGSVIRSTSRTRNPITGRAIATTTNAAARPAPS